MFGADVDETGAPSLRPTGRRLRKYFWHRSVRHVRAAGAMRRVRSILPRQIRMEWRNVALALVWVPLAPMSC